MTNPGAEGTSFKIADAYVLVGGRLDERSVQDAVAQARQEVSGDPAKLMVELDKKSLDTAVAQVQAAVDAVGKDLRIRLGIDLNDKDLTDRAAEMKAFAEDLSKSIKISLQSVLDTASLAKAKTQLKAATEEMSRTDPIKLRVDTSAVDSAKASQSGSGGSGGGGLGFGGLIATGVGVLAGPIEAVGLGALGAAVAGIGIAAEKSNAQVQQSFAGMTSAVKESAQEGFRPLVPTLVDIGNQATTTAKGLQVEFSRAALEVAPQLDSIGSGLLASVRSGVADSEPELQKLQPLADAIGQSFASLEKGISGFGKNIDVSGAVSGVQALSGAFEKAMPALGLLFSAITPLSNALVTVLGGAVNSTARELSDLAPVVRLVGGVLNFLSPAISVLAPPLLAAMLGSKLLTGSWTDLSGAAGKLKGLVSDLPSNFASLGQALGYTSDKAKAAGVTTAEAALQEANLNKQIAEGAATQALEKAQLSGSAEDALAAIQAKKALSAATKEATVAEEAFTAASEVSTFSFGPLGIALGVIGGAIALFAGKSSDAKQPVQDLTADLARLAQTAPNAAQGVLDSDPALAELIKKANDAGINVSQMLDSFNKGPDALSKFKSSVDAAKDALSAQTVTVTRNVQSADGAVTQTEKFTESVGALKASVDGNVDAYNSLTPAQKKLVDQLSNATDVSDQLGTSFGKLSTQQDAVKAVTGSASDATKKWQQYLMDAGFSTTAFGGNLTQTALQMNTFAAAAGSAGFSVESFFKAQLAAAGTFTAAQANFQQLDQAVVQAQQGLTSAGQAADAAAHQVTSASQSIVAAKHSETDAILNTKAAQQGLIQAQNSVASAQQTYNNSLVSEAVAQRALSLARQQAVIDLQNLNRQVIDQADTEASAELKLHDAQTAVNNAGLANTKLKLSDLANQANITNVNENAYQLLLALSQAQHALNDAQAQGQQLTNQNTAAQAAGVDGAQGVISAQQGLTQAQQQAQSSALALASSQQAVIKAGQAVTDAQFAELQAHQAVAQAQYSQMQAQQALTNAKNSELNAQRTLTQAHDAASRSIDINTVAGNRNVNTLVQFYDAQIAAGSSTQQATSNVEAEGQKLGFTKTQVDAVLGSISMLDGKTATFGVVGQPSLDISQLVSAAVQQGIDPHTLGFTPDQVTAGLKGTPKVSGRARAGGGLIRGPGTGTSDSIPAVSESGMLRVSDQEFIVNADATRKNIKLLEIINSGATPGLAAGGGVGSALMHANLQLAGWLGMVAATDNTYGLLGYKGLPTLAANNPPVIPVQGTTGSLSGGNANPATHGSAAQAQAYALSQLGVYGWGPDQMPDLLRLWYQESGWSDTAVNKSSGAAGIAQSLGHGPVQLGDYVSQINWGLNYIKGRYGSPDNAWLHEVGFNWYDQGGLVPQGISMIANGTGRNEHHGILTEDQWQTLKTLASGRAGGMHAHTTVNAYTFETPESIAAKSSAANQWQLMTMRRG